MSDATAAAIVDHAVASGIRYFDTAPFYGFGLAESRLGLALPANHEQRYVLSTKVGRVLRTPRAGEVPPQLAGAPIFPDAPDWQPDFDFSRDGVLRSYEDSISRLGVDRIDILLLHDPENSLDAACTSGLATLRDLREQGAVLAIGAGSGSVDALRALVQKGDLDVILLAGRYTLLDQSALRDLLPACELAGTSVIIGGVFNSGVLTGTAGSDTYEFGPVPTAIAQRVKKIAGVCRRHDVPMASAALQFPLAHPAVISVLTAVRSTSELEANLAGAATRLPTALWDDLREAGLLAADAPVPTGGD